MIKRVKSKNKKAILLFWIVLVLFVLELAFNFMSGLLYPYMSNEI